MEDPDHGWKPNKRPQSTVARNFMSELDNLFKLDGDLDTHHKNLHEKKQAVSTQTQELEALEARLRAAEERLKEAKGSSPPRRKDSQRRTPVEGTFSDQDKAGLQGPNSPLAQKTPQATGNISGALPETPSSHSSADYVLVERPPSAQPVEADKA
ncbi:uncharacterized protein K460DRAFT_373941 [Cucurbitaria berberidis CBS 394.84]|uniref:Uncharacterized protein n=1 Tax=Cucurbitaria berberidis CBS 394.84 TaxID=1168544 RepID=A0A9P4LDM8_9PLEO|nr:uncharacterized protein K460DRAFT_373941 [Cucurbitaria berberidis CBS 394.84]KAF1852081.1 hypothetical protein K460DRAFT_373941 [Cucurbitaria berberidis CBS 394.84]